MEQVISILNLASDVMAMAASVITLVDVALRHRASRIRRGR